MQDQPITPYGYCKCGCGQKTNIAPQSARRNGWVKGEPQPFVTGHRLPKPLPYFPPRLCACGCGKRTARVLRTNRREGVVRGDYRRYIRWHQPVDTRPLYHVEDRGHDTPCWIWARFINPDGYAQRSRGRVTVRPAREFYGREHGPIPDGLEVDHLCNVRACVNPDHLEAVTHAENVRRAVERRRLSAEGRKLRLAREAADVGY